MLAHKIKQLREAKGISRDDMAEHLGISPGSYGKIERGETKLDSERLQSIADRLETDLIDLFNSSSFIITYNDHDKTVRDNGVGVSMKSSHHNDEKLIDYLKEQNASLRKENERLISIVEKLSQLK